MTPAAVSHQVKALEAHLGLALFRRLNNGLALTRAGERYLPLLSEGFDRLAEAARHLPERGGRAVVRVSVLHSVATKWLAPRLARFAESHPDIDLRIDVSDRTAEPRRGEADLAIRYGAGDNPGRSTEALFRDQVFPVCSPALAEGREPLAKPGDLNRHTLLHIDWDQKHGPSPDWRAWLQAAGIAEVDATRGPRFSLSSMAIQAAIDGQGVALGQHLFAADDIAAGRLVRPFGLSLPLAQAYYLVTLRPDPADPATAAFRNWLEAEAARYKALIGMGT